MPYYKPIKDIQNKTGQERIINNLLLLRKDFHGKIPDKTASETLLLATWNIREFRSGKRLEESYHYIAEIISRFDLVAIQEVASDLRALEKLLYLLGKNWDYICTDSTVGGTGGYERMAFVYDKNKISFKNLAGEIVLPEENLIEKNHQYARTPYTVGFQAGWFKFILTTVHIYFGADQSKNDEDIKKYERRVEEIGSIAGFLKNRAEKENQNYIILGDFNIVSPEDKTMIALVKNGFYVPENLTKFATNIDGTKHYDQIAFNVKEEYNMLIFDKKLEDRKAGAYNYYDILFKEGGADIYKNVFDEKYTKGKTDEEIKKYYLKWRTFQMSDHLPLWVELKIDFSDQYLANIRDKK